MKKILKFLLYFVVILLIAFAGFLIFATADNYSPPEQVIVFQAAEPDIFADTGEFSLVTWNIGYCGLNAEMDFFYEGGTQVRPKKDVVLQNLNAVKQTLTELGDIDFLLLQEVDSLSKRSYGLCEIDSISRVFPSYKAAYAKNYDVFFVPQPLTEPMGNVNSGLLTLSKFTPATATRFAYPDDFSWPLSLFFLDRCFLVNRYTLQNDKELVLINTHNSAFDNGSQRDMEMAYLKNFIETEYKKGNYVIAGGDWNQCPPDFRPEFRKHKMDNTLRKDISSEYMPDWKWAYDLSEPSNRRVTTPYNVETTLTTVIDFFLISPNIIIKSVGTKHLEFEHSDHNPVVLNIKLK